MTRSIRVATTPRSRIKREHPPLRSHQQVGGPRIPMGFRDESVTPGRIVAGTLGLAVAASAVVGGVLLAVPL